MIDAAQHNALCGIDATRLAALPTHMDAVMEADGSRMPAQPGRKRDVKGRRPKYHTSETVREIAGRDVQMGDCDAYMAGQGVELLMRCLSAAHP